MTAVQTLEARAIIQTLTPTESADGVSCRGPAALITRFEECLRERGISVEVFLGLDFPDRIRHAELVHGVDHNTHVALVKDFADHLATSPGESIPGYWGGSLPDARSAPAPGSGTN